MWSIERDIASDLGWPLTPQTTPIFTFYVDFHIFIVSEYGDFKFGVRVDNSKSQSMDDKLSLKGAWSRYVTHFKFLVPLK